MEVRQQLANLSVVLNGVPAAAEQENVVKFACDLGISRVISLDCIPNSNYAADDKSSTVRWTVRCDNEKEIKNVLAKNEYTLHWQGETYQVTPQPCPECIIPHEWELDPLQSQLSDPYTNISASQLFGSGQNDSSDGQLDDWTLVQPQTAETGPKTNHDVPKPEHIQHAGQNQYQGGPHEIPPSGEVDPPGFSHQQPQNPKHEEPYGYHYPSQLHPQNIDPQRPNHLENVPPTASRSENQVPPTALIPEGQQRFGIPDQPGHGSEAQQGSPSWIPHNDGDHPEHAGHPVYAVPSSNPNFNTTQQFDPAFHHAQTGVYTTSNYAGPQIQYAGPQIQYAGPQIQYADPKPQYAVPQSQFAGLQSQYYDQSVPGPNMRSAGELYIQSDGTRTPGYHGDHGAYNVEGGRIDDKTEDLTPSNIDNKTHDKVTKWLESTPVQGQEHDMESQLKGTAGLANDTKLCKADNSYAFHARSTEQQENPIADISDGTSFGVNNRDGLNRIPETGPRTYDPHQPHITGIGQQIHEAELKQQAENHGLPLHTGQPTNEPGLKQSQFSGQPYQTGQPTHEPGHQTPIPGQSSHEPELKPAQFRQPFQTGQPTHEPELKQSQFSGQPTHEPRLKQAQVHGQPTHEPELKQSQFPGQPTHEPGQQTPFSGQPTPEPELKQAQFPGQPTHEPGLKQAQFSGQPMHIGQPAHAFGPGQAMPNMWQPQEQYLYEQYLHVTGPHGNNMGYPIQPSGDPPPYNSEMLGSKVNEEQQIYIDKIKSKEEALQKSNLEQHSCAIKVTKLPLKVSEESLMGYFENTRRNGGGPVEKVEILRNGKEAIIYFEEEQGANLVLSKAYKAPLKLENVTIDVCKYFEDSSSESICEISESESDPECIAIKVEGFTPETSEDAFMNHFENTRRHGGGTVIDIQMRADVVYITFESPETVESVLTREHKISGSRLVVSRYTPPKPRPIDDKKLFFAGLCGTTTNEVLQNFIEAKSRCNVEKVIFGEKPGTALVIMEEIPDFNKLKTILSTKSLESACLSVERVHITNCIHVSGYPENTTLDTIKYHFSNEKRNHGGPVEKVDLQDGYAVVFFQDVDCIDGVCKKEQKIGGSKVSLKPYYEFLGEIVGDGSSQLVAMPDPLTMSTIDPYIIKFLQESSIVRQSLIKEMEGSQCTVCLPDQQGEHMVLKCSVDVSAKGAHGLIKKWKERAEASLLSFLGHYELHKLPVLQEAWPGVVQSLRTMDNIQRDSCVPFIVDSSHTIVVVQHKDAHPELLKSITFVIQEMEKEIERRKKEIMDTVNDLKPHELRYLLAIKFVDLFKKAPKVKINLGSNEIVFRGLANEIKDAKLKMYEMRTQMVFIPIKIQSACLSILDNKEVRDHIVSKLKQRNLLGVWNVHNARNEVHVYSQSSIQARDVANVIEESVIEHKIGFRKEAASLMQSQNWIQRMADIQQQFHGELKIDTDIMNSQINVYATDTVLNNVKEVISEFLMHNTVLQKSINCGRGKTRFLQLHKMAEINQIQQKLLQFNVEIIFTASKHELVIKGNEEGLSFAVTDLHLVASSVICKTHVLKTLGAKKLIQSEKGAKFLRNMEKIHACSIELEDDVQDQGFVVVDVPSPKTAFTRTCSDGRQIHVLEGDMTQMTVDAIVNAANGALDHVGGIARSIVIAGGESIQEECSAIISKQGSNLLEGEAVSTGPGNLNCMQIIHVVGPSWQGGHSDEKKLLQECVFKSMEMAADKKCRSIAFPAISTGVFGYPVMEATKAIVEAIKDHMQRNPSCSVREIYLCDITKSNSLLCFQKHLEELILGSSVTKPAEESTICDITKFIESTKMDRHYAETIPKHGYEPTNFQDTEYTSVKQPKNPSARCPITIKLIKGELAQQNADILVNTTSNSLELTNGAVSKSLLNAAGPQLQTECLQNYPNGLQTGELAITSGYKLNCKVVCHGSLPQFSTGNAKAMLQTFVQGCLNQAVMNNCTSIAFPALGTGILGYPRDMAAKEMYAMVSEFGRKHPNTLLKEVKFVVYPTDTLTVKAFEAEERLCVGVTVSMPDNDESTRSQRSYGGIQHSGKFSSPSRSVLADTLTFDDITVKVVSGDILEATTDAIVNSSNTELDLTQGIVSQILLKRCGQQLAQECQKKVKAMHDHHVVTTSAPGLKCKTIIHIAADPFNWKNLINKCLHQVEKKQMSSISFPVLGTGSYRDDNAAVNFAKALSGAIRDFHKKSPPRHLNLVQVVVYQPHFFHPVLTELNKVKQSWAESFKEFIFGKPSSEDASYKSRDTSSKSRDVILYIHSDSQQQIDEVIKDIETTAEGETITKVISDPKFENMDEKKTSQIIRLGNEHDVDISIEKRLGRVKMIGRPTDVLAATTAMFNEVCNALEEKAAQNLSQSVRWYIVNASGKLEPYPDLISSRLEGAYIANKRIERFPDNKNNYYIVDFQRMAEHPEDEPTDVVSVVRRDLIKQSGSSFPAHWAPMNDKNNLLVVDLKPTDPEYQDVVKSTNGLSNITKIQRIQNRSLYQQYSAKKQHMEMEASRTDVERRLFHGTSVETIESINNLGFNRSYCGKNATYYGNGVYFASQSNYSARDAYAVPDKSGTKYMYAAQVLTGSYTLGKKEMRVPPPKTSKKSHVLYDSVVDSVKNPELFVIFHDTQAYPSYLIFFK